MTSSKRKRRPRGDGTVYQRGSDGRWIGAYTLSGKRKYVSARSAKEAADKLRVARARAGKIPGHRLTVSEWLEAWIDEAERDRLFAGGTVDNYRGRIKKWIDPAIGTKRLATLTAQDLRDLLAGMDGKASGNVRASVLYIAKGALEEAFRRELVSENVALRIRAPKVVKGRRRAIGLALALDFIAASRGDRNEALYLLLLCQGLREAEAFGLYPEDVDLEARVIRIERQLYERPSELVEIPPKGGKLVTIPLAELVIPALRRHLEARAAHPPAVRYLFTSEKGQRLRRSVFLRKMWHKFREAHNLPYFVPHQLRHTTSTLLKSLGVPIEVRKEILRHADIKTTDQHYDDEVPELQRAALAALSDLLTPSP